MPIEYKDQEYKESKAEILRRQSIERFLKFDQEKMISLFDLPHDEETMSIQFLGQTYTINRKNGELMQGERFADLDEMASIYEFLTTAIHLPNETNDWQSIAALCTNTTDTSLGRYIEYLKPFEGKLSLMQEACAKLGGVPASKGDVSSLIPVFNGITVWFQYWEADDEFPASVQFLWDASIKDFFRWSILWNIMTCITKRMREVVGLD